jgi:hypothetical protein
VKVACLEEFYDLLVGFRALLALISMRQCIDDFFGDRQLVSSRTGLIVAQGRLVVVDTAANNNGLLSVRTTIETGGGGGGRGGGENKGGGGGGGVK